MRPYFNVFIKELVDGYGQPQIYKTVNIQRSKKNGSLLQGCFQRGIAEDVDIEYIIDGIKHEDDYCCRKNRGNVNTLEAFLHKPQRKPNHTICADKE